MLVPFAIAACAQEALSLPASYMTLKDVAALLSSRGIPVSAAPSIAGLAAGIRLEKAPGQAVLDSLNGLGRLSVRKAGSGWIIESSPAVERSSRIERGRFAAAMARGLAGACGSSLLADLYRLPDDRRQLEIQTRSGSFASLSPYEQLVVGHFASGSPSYGELRLPLLGAGLLDPRLHQEGGRKTLWELSSWAAPFASRAVDPMPYMPPGPEREGLLGMLIGGPEEKPQAKRSRLQAVASWVDLRWDPSAMRGVFTLAAASPAMANNGTPYEGVYPLPLVRAASLSVPAPDRRDLLTPEHRIQAEAAARASEPIMHRLAEGPHAEAKGPALLSDLLLAEAEKRKMSLVFLVPSLFNVPMGRADGGIPGILRQAADPETAGAGSDLFSEHRLGLARQGSRASLLPCPVWTAAQRGGITTLCHDLGFLEELTGSGIYSISLANARLKGTSLPLLKTIEEAGAAFPKTPSPDAAFPNEAFTDFSPARLYPFAVLAARPGPLREVLSTPLDGVRTMLLSRFSAQDRQALAQAFRDAASFAPLSGPTRPALLVAADIEFNSPGALQIELYPRPNGGARLALVYDDERIWTARAGGSPPLGED